MGLGTIFSIILGFVVLVTKSTPAFQDRDSINYDSLAINLVLNKTSDSEECTAEGLFPYEHDCTMYFQCIYYDNEWYYFLFQCAAGGHYDAEYQACIFGPCPEGETTLDTTTTSEIIPTSPIMPSTLSSTQSLTTFVPTTSFTTTDVTSESTTSSPKPCRKYKHYSL